MIQMEQTVHALLHSSACSRTLSQGYAARVCTCAFLAVHIACYALCSAGTEAQTVWVLYMAAVYTLHG